MRYIDEFYYVLSGWQPFLSDLGKYYQTDKELEPLIQNSNESKLSLENYHVNLVLIDSAQHEDVVKQQTNSNSLQQEMRYQEMLLSGETLSFNALFPDNKKTSDWALVTGRAGAGKTTLLQYIAYRWGMDKEFWHYQFNFVFRVPLSLLKDYKGSGDTKEILSAIIWQGFDRKKAYTEVLSQANILKCLQAFPKETLLLVDGIDQVAELYRQKNSRIQNFIDDMMRIFPNGIMTTRPDAISNELTKKFRRHYENVGFSTENVERYVKKY